MAYQPYQTTESKKEDFRKYLESSGVIDQLTRVLVGLYEEPEKPQNGVEFIKKYMGTPSDVEIDKVLIENDRLKDENLKLKRQIEEMKKELDMLKPNEE